MYLLTQYGTILAFNRSPDKEPKPISFYIGGGDGKLFIDPIRPNFARQAIPILYSEMWGDYFADFSVYMIDSRSNKYISGRAFEYETLEKRLSKWAITNRFKFNSYLGRINLVSLFPTGILLMGGIYGQILALQALRNSSNERKKILGLTSNIVSVTMLGFLWFLIRTPMGGPGDTLKTTYFLQIFPFLAIQSGTLIQRIQSKPILYCLGFTLVVISIHNLPAMVTHFIELPWQTKLWSW